MLGNIVDPPSDAISEPKVCVGVDAGGTSVKICAYDRTTRKVLFEARIERGLNLASTPESEQRSLLVELKNLIFRELSSLDDVAFRFAVSGAMDEGRRERFKHLLSTVFPEVSGHRLSVEGDAEVAMRLCVGNEPGVLVICGTGSVVLGGGKRVGGWGYLFGDEAGAFSVVVRLIRELFNYVDGVGVFDPVFEQLLEYFDVSTPDELVHVQSVPDFRSRIARFAAVMTPTPLVLKVLNEELELLTAKVKVLANELELKRVVAFGGMFRNELFYKLFATKLEGFEVGKCDVEPHVALAME